MLVQVFWKYSGNSKEVYREHSERIVGGLWEDRGRIVGGKTL